MTRKEARKQIVDVKVVRGAKIGSYHYLVLMKVKLRICRNGRGLQKEE